MAQRFSPKDHQSLISAFLNDQGGAHGIHLRQPSFLDDLRRIAELPVSDADTMNPCYGMSPEGSNEDLTLICEISGETSGQVSFAMEAQTSGGDICVEIHVIGIFLSDEKRGEGLGKAVLEQVGSLGVRWGRSLDSDCCVEIQFHGDTEVGSSAEKIIDLLNAKNDLLIEDQGCDPGFST